METILIQDRKSTCIKGATKIISSTNNQAIIEINQTQLILGGNNLEITKLNLDEKEVCFSGEFISLKFANKLEKKPLLKRLFK
ncbi:MAG: hypothetical protein J6J24_03810 [Clostridia bacterium]|nr:hypothetical protein [Clostridia bacterium]